MSPVLSSRAVRSLPLVAVLLTGCGGPNSAPVYRQGQGQGGAAPEAVKAEAVAQAPPAGNPAPAKEPAVGRKIIYTAHLDVVVKDLDEAVRLVNALVADHKGYVAKSELRSDAYARRSGSFTVRVPVEDFRKFVDAAAALGTAERNATDSQDVTEEFVDVTARVKNLKAEEETLNKLLKDRAAVLDDVLKIRGQITAVRGDVERAEARLKYLGTLSALSTVNLTLREVKDYKPPTAPTFGSRIGTAFAESVDRLREFGEGLVVFGVALAPWLPVLLLVGYGLVRGVRRVVRWVGETLRPPARPASLPRSTEAGG
jgi:hypothetical protein